MFLSLSKQVLQKKRSDTLLCLPLCVRCYQVSYSGISVPTTVTGACAPGSENCCSRFSQRKALPQEERVLTDSLNSFARLCDPYFTLNHQCTLSLKSIITTAPVLQKWQHQFKRSSVCLFVCPCVCLLCLSFLPGSRGEKENG